MNNISLNVLAMELTPLGKLEDIDFAKLIQYQPKI